MGFKTKEEIQDIISGGIYKCDVHEFYCDKRDLESVKKHEEEFAHTVSGEGLCQRCKSAVVHFKGLPKPKVGNVPGAFCNDCKKALATELGLVAPGGNE